MKAIVSENIFNMQLPKHAAGVLPICRTTGRILLCKRGSKISNPNKWANLGGKQNVGENDAPITAVREFYEESGCIVPVKLIPSYVDEHDDGFKYYNFIGLVDSEFKPKIGKVTVDGDIEIDDYKWVTFDEFIKFDKDKLHFGIKQLIKNAKTQIKNILNKVNPHVMGLKESKIITEEKNYVWWVSRFRNRYYKSKEEALNDIHHAVEHSNNQVSTKIFGETDTQEIIDAFNLIYLRGKNMWKLELKKQYQPKKKKKEYEYNTDDDLIFKQKALWLDNYGQQMGRFFENGEFKTNDKKIYGTESTQEWKVQNIMAKIKEGEYLPPILLDYDFGILDGHHRWEAAKRLKVKTIPVIIYRYPEEEQD